MHQSILLAALAGAGVSYAATTTIKAKGLVFQPASATAAVGDVIEFHLLPGNHSAVMGDFGSPCKPAGSGKGFSSGFLPSLSGENAQVFQVTINDTNPIVYYCSQPSGAHCKSGMIGFINADDQTAKASYISAARSASASDPGAMFGGVLIANPTASAAVSASSAAGTSSTTGEASSVTSGASSMTSGASSTTSEASSATGSTSAAASAALGSMSMTMSTPMSTASAASSASTSTSTSRSDAAGFSASGNFGALMGSGLLALAMAMFMA